MLPHKGIISLWITHLYQIPTKPSREEEAMEEDGDDDPPSTASSYSYANGNAAESQGANSRKAIPKRPGRRAIPSRQSDKVLLYLH